MATAILMQVVHDPHKYMPELLMRQAGMYMLRNPYRYYKALELELIKTGESYESYIFNVFHQNIWADDLITAVISDMLNIAISIVTPLPPSLCFLSFINKMTILKSHMNYSNFSHFLHQKHNIYPPERKAICTYQ